jgi:hypothetical protein
MKITHIYRDGDDLTIEIDESYDIDCEVCFRLNNEGLYIESSDLVHEQKESLEKEFLDWAEAQGIEQDLADSIEADYWDMKDEY